MREYSDKKNAQRKHYYKDRFLSVPSTQKLSVTDSIYQCDVEFLKQNNITIKDSFIELGQLVIQINHDQIYQAIQAMHDFGYEQLNDISAIDFLSTCNKFKIFYQLLSISAKKRARIVCYIEPTQSIQSVNKIYKSANWAEREMYDMFGIFIKGHHNLKRILMPDDWVSHPLLKAYPLHGDEHAQWYEVDKIFGKEARDEIGAENRDSAFIDSKDTFNFANIGDENLAQDYQEDGGVAFIKKVSKKSIKTIKERP